MIRRFSVKRVSGFFLLDWLGTIGMLVAAAYLRVEIGILPQPILTILESLQIPFVNWWEGMRPEDILVLPVFILISIIWPLFFTLFSVYDGRRNETLRFELLNVFMAITASTLVLAGLLFLTYRSTSRAMFVIFLILDLALLLGARMIWQIYRETPIGKKYNLPHPVIIIGAGKVGQNVAIELQTISRKDYKLVGFLDDDPGKYNQMAEDIPILGNLDQVSDVVDTYQIHDAVVALPLRAHDRLVDTCKTLQDHSVRVHVVPDLFDITFPGTNLVNFNGLPIIDLGDPFIHGSWQIVKRLFDLLAVVPSLLLFSPLFLAIAVLIKIDSSGPVFYYQKRIGLGGKPFQMFKFRTMYHHADSLLSNVLLENPQLHKEWHEYQKLTNDPRITRVGKVIRRLSFDELPQLWNVLIGEMSLIGPRPFLPSQIEFYGKRAFKNYIRVRPGLTGMWQVSGRNQASFSTRAQWDEYYIRNWSVWLDLSILFRTIGVVLKRSGAY